MRPLIAAVIGGLLLVGGAPPAIAGAADQADLSVEVADPGSRYFHLYVDARPVSLYAGANAPQFMGIHPPLIIDTSGLSAKVTLGALPANCGTSGTRAVCNASAYYNNLMIPFVMTPGAEPGPAGYVIVRVEPTPGTDPDPSNDRATIEVDVRGPSAPATTTSAPRTQSQPRPTQLGSTQPVALTPGPMPVITGTPLSSGSATSSATTSAPTSAAAAQPRGPTGQAGLAWATSVILVLVGGASAVLWWRRRADRQRSD